MGSSLVMGTRSYGKMLLGKSCTLHSASVCAKSEQMPTSRLGLAANNK